MTKVSLLYFKSFIFFLLSCNWNKSHMSTIKVNKLINHIIDQKIKCIIGCKDIKYMIGKSIGNISLQSGYFYAILMMSSVGVFQT